jgi:hypothetical protein
MNLLGVPVMSFFLPNHTSICTVPHELLADLDLRENIRFKSNRAFYHTGKGSPEMLLYLELFGISIVPYPGSILPT